MNVFTVRFGFFAPAWMGKGAWVRTIGLDWFGLDAETCVRHVYYSGHQYDLYPGGKES